MYFSENEVPHSPTRAILANENFHPNLKIMLIDLMLIVKKNHNTKLTQASSSSFFEFLAASFRVRINQFFHWKVITVNEIIAVDMYFIRIHMLL